MPTLCVQSIVGVGAAVRRSAKIAKDHGQECRAATEGRACCLLASSTSMPWAHSGHRRSALRGEVSASPPSQEHSAETHDSPGWLTGRGVARSAITAAGVTAVNELNARPQRVEQLAVSAANGSDGGTAAVAARWGLVCAVAVRLTATSTA